jgi:hypothetical protein
MLKFRISGINYTFNYKTSDVIVGSPKSFLI